MAPPPPSSRRSQNAADALLSESSLASQLQSRAVASAKATAARKADATNPYRQPPSRPLATGAARAAAGSAGGGKVGGAGRKRPLQSLRGKNDSTSTRLGTSGATPRPSAQRGSSSGRPGGNPPASSAFARRNARDRTSHAPPPPTGTDGLLMALLDGPAKKTKATNTTLAGGRGMTAGGPAHKRSLGPQGTKGGAEKRPKRNGISGVVVAPPPRGRSVGIRPRKVPKAMKMNKEDPTRKRAKDGGGKKREARTRGGERGTGPEAKAAPPVALDESKTTREGMDNLAGDKAPTDGAGGETNRGAPPSPYKRSAPSSGKATGGGEAPRTAAAAAFPASAANTLPTSTAEGASETSSKCAEDKAESSDAAAMDTAAFDAAMPADEELMALPLGIGARPAKSRKRASRGRANASFGSAKGALSKNGKSMDVGSTRGSVEEAVLRDNTDETLANAEESLTSRTSEQHTANELDTSIDDAAEDIEGNDKATQLADWYDADEQADIDKEAALQKAMKDAESDGNPRGGGRRSKSKGGVNENFVRLDLRNAAGSCRGARNLKKVNKQKLWRAQHRFGMSDHGADAEGGGGSIYSRNRSTRTKDAAGDAKCFASARNAGVDPLDDFMDGTFAGEDGTKGSGDGKEGAATNAKGNGNAKKKPLKRRNEDDGGVPVCTRHQRPCKLLTVKKNTKGNKGRKFYACSMPRGEQCDFFKWEEDTVEATQRALLRSSSNSGFIARQVAAARARFKELTVPELRVEAKKRGLQSTGKKDQILTRLTIWIRDEIANSVEGEPKEGNDDGGTSTQDVNGEANADENDGTTTASDSDALDVDEAEDGSNDGCGDNSDEESDEPQTETAADGAGMIELSDDYDESSYDDDDSSHDGESCDELEICHEPEKKQQSRPTTTKNKDAEEATLEDSLQKHFGHSAFRPGQEWAIRRCLTHRRTLLVAPTGQGKSLCYALPSLIMPGICIVVSPLISLMQDQLRQLPPKVTAATLSGSITTSQMALIVDDILRGRYKVLFVSPERLASAAFRRLIRPKFNPETRQFERKFPTVSLLCVDEAHCLSQWGHNFRPSYLRVKSLIPMLKPKSVLALTATAGPMVIRDICNTLSIPYNGSGAAGGVPSSPSASTAAIVPDAEAEDEDGVEVLNCDRDNIDVFSLVLQNNDERRYLLHKILRDKKDDSERPKKLPIEEGCLSKGSVIVYVWRQKDTEIVAEQLNGAGIRGGVVCYHGGMDSNARSKAQSKFLRGKARICVATVAFGLGINKPDIVGIIHLCLPPSPEHYLQEIGRAGRDGRPAKAIALPLVDEFVSRHSLAHSDRLSSRQIEIVFLALQKLVDDALSDIPPEAGVDLDADEIFVDGVHVGMPVSQTVDASDCKEESIETIFSLLEGETPADPSLLSVEGYLPDAATITLKRRSLEKLGAMEQIAQSISKCGTRVDGENGQTDPNATDPLNKHHNFGGTAMEKGFYAYSFGTYKFSVVRCARCMGPEIEPRHVYAALRRLQSSGELELVLDTTPNGRAMHLRMKQDGINLFRTKGCNSQSQDYEIDANASAGAIVSKLSKQFLAKEKLSVGKVDSMYEIMHRLSFLPSHDNGGNDDNDACDEDDDFSSQHTHETTKSPRLVMFQKLVKDYFRQGSIAEKTIASTMGTRPSNRATDVIKDFPLHNKRLLSCLSSDVSQLMQMLVIRRQEQMPIAVRVNEPEFSEYRDLSVAKILHAIDAPRAPILGWYSHHLWGKYRSYSFPSVVEAVKRTFDNA